VAAPHPDLDVELGFKGLTVENWLTPDPALELFVRMSIVGPIQITPDQWAEKFLAVRLDVKVPRDVRRLFAVARSVFVYGAFFYPLYGLGEERLFVVADAAVLHRYRGAGGALQANGQWPRYVERLQWLHDEALFDADSFERWQALRKLRNLAAHPEQQTVLPPGQALEMLTTIARDINALFAGANQPAA
jgi:hypothetical protein